MKTKLFILASMLILRCTSPESQSTKTVTYITKGSHGYIMLFMPKANNNFPEFIISSIENFERVKHVKVTNFIPDLRSGGEKIEGVWVTFEPEN